MIFRRKSKSRLRGFTILEMVVSATIIILMSTFVLASYRAARYSGELDVVLKQVINGISTVKVKGVSGNIVLDPNDPNEELRIYPNTGYAMKVVENDNYISLYGLEIIGPIESHLDEEEILFPDVSVFRLCGLDATSIDEEICGSGWDSLSSVELIFGLSGDVVFRDDLGAVLNYEYIGGILMHQGTGKRASFYVPAATGIAIGGLIE